MLPEGYTESLHHGYYVYHRGLTGRGIVLPAPFRLGQRVRLSARGYEHFRHCLKHRCRRWQPVGTIVGGTYPYGGLRVQPDGVRRVESHAAVFWEPLEPATDSLDSASL